MAMTSFLSCCLVKYLISFENLITALVSKVLFRRELGKIRRILLFRSSRMGDFMVAVPAISLVRKHYPEAQIALLCTDSGDTSMSRITGLPEWFDFVDNKVDEIFFVKGSELLTDNNKARTTAFVRKFNPDVTIILPFSGEGLRSRLKKFLYLRLTGISKNIHGISVLSDLAIGTWMSRLQFACGLTWHQVNGPLRSVIELTGDDNITIDPSIAVNHDKVRHEVKTTPGPLVVVFPGGTFEHKIWPAQRYATLLRALHHEFSGSLHYALIGGGNDVEICSKIIKTCHDLPVIDWSGTLNLHETAYLIGKSLLFIGNDGGPAHVSAAMHIPTITLFSGIVFPGQWEPIGAEHLAVRKAVACQYCFSSTHCPTGTNECILAITMDDILEMVIPLTRERLKLQSMKDI